MKFIILYSFVFLFNTCRDLMGRSQTLLVLCRKVVDNGTTNIEL